jgi:uncharacterized protein (DUF58 family)
MIHSVRLGGWAQSIRGSLGRVPHPACEASLHMRSRTLPLALLAFLVWQFLRPDPFAATGIAFAGTLLLIGFAWARALAGHVTTRRVIRFTSLQVGDHLEEILFLENPSWWPVVHAEFIDHSTLPGHAIDGVRVGASRGIRSWRLDTVCRQRGLFVLGQWDVYLRDPFGLFEARQRYRQPETITVYPTLADLPSTATRHRTVGDRAPLRQPLRAETISALTTRPYVAGDSLRRIHWRTTARRGELFIRTFDPEALSPTWLLLDLDRSVHVGEGPESSLEKMIMAAAAIASDLLDQRLAVGLVLDAKGTTVVPPRSGRGGLWEILGALAAIESGPTRLEVALGSAAQVVTSRDSLAILTPSTDPSWVRALPSLAEAAIGTVEAWLLDPASFGGSGEIAAIEKLLGGRGIPVHVLRRSDIRPRSGSVARIIRRPWAVPRPHTGRGAMTRVPARPAANRP